MAHVAVDFRLSMNNIDAMLTPAQHALAEFFASDKHRTQRWMAMVLGVSQSTVSLWMRGKSRPPTAHAVAIFHLTGIPVEAWLTDSERRIVASLSVTGHKLLEQFSMSRGVAIDERQLPMFPGGESVPVEPSEESDAITRDFMEQVQWGSVEVFGADASEEEK